MRQLMDEANQIRPPAGTDPSRSSFWTFFRNIVQFMLNMIGQFMRLFTGFPGLGGSSKQLLVARYQEKEKDLNEKLNYLDTDWNNKQTVDKEDEKHLIEQVTHQLHKARDQIEQALRV